MTFEFTGEQAAIVVRAGAVAEMLRGAVAEAVDASGVVPEQAWSAFDAASLGHAVSAGGPVAVGVIAAVAEASAGAAAGMALAAHRGGAAAPRGSGADRPWAGLRGAAGELDVVVASGRAASIVSALTLAAVALGVGRAAIAEAVEAMKQKGARPSGDETTPHWQMADAAAEVEGARWLTLQAAQDAALGTADRDIVAAASRQATTAAQKAVEAAMMIAGPDSGRVGAVLERLARDAQTLALLAAHLAVV